MLKNKLIDSEYINSIDKFDINVLKELLIKKFKEIDYTEAKEDIIPFIKNIDVLNMWSSKFFVAITEKLNKI